MQNVEFHLKIFVVAARFIRRMCQDKETKNNND